MSTTSGLWGTLPTVSKQHLPHKLLRDTKKSKKEEVPSPQMPAPVHCGLLPMAAQLSRESPAPRRASPEPLQYPTLPSVCRESNCGHAADRRQLAFCCGQVPAVRFHHPYRVPSSTDLHIITAHSYSNLAIVGIWGREVAKVCRGSLTLLRLVIHTYLYYLDCYLLGTILVASSGVRGLPIYGKFIIQ